MKSVLLLIITSFPLLAEEFDSVTVLAGEHDRRNTVVSFRLQRPLARNAALVAAGNSYPLQTTADGLASFVLDRLDKGQELTLRMGTTETLGRLESRWETNKVKLGRSSQPWLEYQAQPGPLPRANIKEVFKRAHSGRGRHHG